MRTHAIAPMLVLAACGGGGISRGVPIDTVDAAPELVYSRSRRDSPGTGTEIVVGSRFGLVVDDLPDRAGAESGVRVHPDGVRILFCRESGGPEGREIHLAHIDGSAPESRLTANRVIDDAPCWSGDGSRVVFSSDRGGTGRRLWTMDLLGEDARPVFDDGTEQRDPDAHGALIAFSRHDPLASPARAAIWIVDTASGPAMRVTDGGTGTSDDGVPGDYEPAFSPDGRQLVFTRSVAGSRRRLMRVDLATMTVEALGDGAGDDRWPRWTPAGDSLLVARSRPLAGLDGLRLYEVELDGSDPLAILPDARFDYPGFDPLPGLGTRPGLSGPTLADPGRFRAELAFGAGAAGEIESLADADGFAIQVLTAEFEQRQRGGLRIEIPLEVDDPATVGRVDLTVRAAISRADGDPLVRLTLFDTLESRNDTVLERRPAGTGIESYEVSIQSLAHVSRAGALVLAVIADLTDGERAELAVDQVVVSFRTRL